MRMRSVLLALCLFIIINNAHSNWIQGLLGRFRPGNQQQRQTRLLDSAQYDAIGLRNLGNTCYLNSVLQGLFYVQDFRDSILQSSFKKSSVGSELQKVFADLSNRGGRTFADADHLVQSLGINVAIQEDAQEFFLRLVNAIDSDSTNATASKASEVFAGETEQTIKCVGVEYSKTKRQKFLDLSMDASRFDRIEESMQFLLTDKDRIDEYRTPDHGQQMAEKSLQLSRLPRALCLHLKRFHFNPDTETTAKIGARISFPFYLDMSKFMSGASVYEIAAIVVHEGSATAGHYTCFARPDFRKAPDCWIKLNDHDVTPVSEEVVRVETYGGSSSGDRSRNAYMLFYVKR